MGWPAAQLSRTAGRPRHLTPGTDTWADGVSGGSSVDNTGNLVRKLTNGFRLVWFLVPKEQRTHLALLVLNMGCDELDTLGKIPFDILGRTIFGPFQQNPKLS